MNWVTANLVEVLIVVGLILLAIEVTILGFSTFVLFFAGIGLLLTGLLMMLNVITVDLHQAALYTLIFTGLAALLLWKPLLAMQRKVENKTVNNDLIGHRFILSEPISNQQHSVYRFSGIDWQLISEQPIEAHSEVEVIKMDVGIFYIRQVE